MHPSASLAVSVGMAIVALGVAASVVIAYAWVVRKDGSGRAAPFAAGVFAWVAWIAILGAIGTLRRYDVRPPPMVLAVAAGFLITIAVARSRIGAQLARGLPLAALIGFHAFRLPLELVMHRAATEGTMPAQMSFGGSNFDIVTGLSAIVVAWLAARDAAPRWLVMTWAVMSSALLAIIVVVAIVSTPLIAAYGTSPDRLNTWVGWFPFTWLPLVLVPAALFGQIVLFRRLATERGSGD